MTKTALHFLLFALAVLFTLPVAAHADHARPTERGEAPTAADGSFGDEHYTREVVHLKVIATSQKRTTGPGYVHTSTRYVLTPQHSMPPDDATEPGPDVAD